MNRKAIISSKGVHILVQSATIDSYYTKWGEQKKKHYLRIHRNGWRYRKHHS